MLESGKCILHFFFWNIRFHAPGHLVDVFLLLAHHLLPLLTFPAEEQKQPEHRPCADEVAEDARQQKFHLIPLSERSMRVKSDPGVRLCVIPEPQPIPA